MRFPQTRTRSLMIAVAAVAFLLWGGRLAGVSFHYVRLANQYGQHAVGWRSIAGRKQGGMAEFAVECANYFERLEVKYRRASLMPWRAVEPDPLAPGNPGYLPE